MENPNKIKRSIRIPREINEKLKEEAVLRGISVNKVIIERIEEGEKGERKK